MTPRRLTLRGIDFKVKQVDEIPPSEVEGGEEDEVILGTYDWRKATIELRRDIPRERKRITLLHECLHGLTEDMDIDEDETSELSWRLYDFIKQNNRRLGIWGWRRRSLF